SVRRIDKFPSDPNNLGSRVLPLPACPHCVCAIPVFSNGEVERTIGQTLLTRRLRPPGPPRSTHGETKSRRKIASACVQRNALSSRGEGTLQNGSALAAAEDLDRLFELLDALVVVAGVVESLALVVQRQSHGAVVDRHRVLGGRLDQKVTEL